MSQLPAPSLITELEVRQDEALHSLAELEQRIVAAIAQFAGVLPKSAKTTKEAGNSSGNLADVPQPTSIKLKIHQPAEEPDDEDDSAAA